MQTGMLLIKRELWEHASLLNEAENRISNIEEVMYQAQATKQTHDKTNQYIIRKREDLENRLKHSNCNF